MDKKTVALLNSLHKSMVTIIKELIAVEKKNEQLEARVKLIEDKLKEKS